MSLFDIRINNSECTKEHLSCSLCHLTPTSCLTHKQRATPYTPTAQNMTSTEMPPSKNLGVCAGLKNLKLHLLFPISLSCTQTFPENPHIDKVKEVM